jgi:endoglucanase
MRTLLHPFLLAALLLGHAGFAARAGSPPSPYIHSAGTSFVLEGSIFTPRGVNLGNWFVPEPYMVGGGTSNEQVRQSFISLAGSTANYQAWRAAYLTNYITQEDIQSLARQGFNTIRVPLDWRDFIDSNNNAVATGLYGGTLPSGAPVGLAYLDNLLSWCTASGVYVLLDMHVTPSTVDNNNEIYVSSTTQVSSTLNQVKAAWSTIAQRYQLATNLLGYDLLNEPPGSLNSEYRPTYQQIQAAIRLIDTNHLLVLESNVYADLGNTISGTGYLGAPIDGNMAISIHDYGSNALPPASIDADYPTAANSYNGRQYYAWAYANSENVPVLIGETGENNNNWVNAIFHLWTVGKVGTSGSPITGGVLYWTYKKPGDAVRSFVSVPFTANWPAIETYLNNGGAVPDGALATMMDQANLSGFGDETLHRDVVDALLNDYNLVAPSPYPTTVPAIPGLINATAYDMGLESTTATPASYSPYSYFSANPQTQTYQIRDDCVGTYLNNGTDAVGYNTTGDWQNYTVQVTPGTYQVFLDYGAPSSGPQIGLTLNGTSLLTTAALPATGGYQTYQEKSLGNVVITASGTATLRITAVQAGLDYTYVRFAAPAVPAATDVSSQVSVTRTGLKLNRATGYFVQTVTLTNTSGSVITGPVALVLDGLTTGTVLENATGVTSSTSPSGHPYITASAAALAPGGTVSLTLSFNQISAYTTRVLAGSPNL